MTGATGNVAATPTAQRARDTARSLRLDRVALTYPGAEGVQALADVSFEVEAGDFVSVVGPSGCGKSSLMKLASGLLRPTAGVLEMGGRPVTGPTATVGMAFQNPSLLPWRSSLDNVMLPLEIAPAFKARMRSRVGRAELRDKALALLETVGLGDAAALTPAQLSGGMRQRVSLCRSLIHDPGVLILDEPFGALDAFTREDLWGVLYRLWRAERFTCVLVTHDLREAALLASKIVVLSKRPATVMAVQTPPFDHPRDPEILFDPEMAAFTRGLRDLIGRATKGESPDPAPPAALQESTR